MKKSSQQKTQVSPAKVLAHHLAEGTRLIGLFGMDTVRRKRAEVFAEKTLRKRALSLEVLKFRASDDLTDELASTLLSQGLFCDTRLVTVSGVENLKKNVKKRLLGILEQDISPHTLILSGLPLQRNDPLESLLKERGAIINFEVLSPPDLRRWAQRELKAQNIAIADEACIDTLVALSHEDLDGLARHIEHLSLYLEPNTALSVSDIEALFGSHSSFREFELLDALSSSNQVHYLQLVRHLLQEGKSPLMLLGILSRALRMYHLIIAGQQAHVPESTIRTTLKLKPWLFQKYSRAAKAFTYQQLQRAHLYFVHADTLMKNRSAGAEAILMNLYEHLKDNKHR